MKSGKFELGETCEHGQLARSCDVCEAQADAIRVEELEAALARRGKCFWDSGCANSERCAEFGICLAKVQKALMQGIKELEAELAHAKEVNHDFAINYIERSEYDALKKQVQERGERMELLMEQVQLNDTPYNVLWDRWFNDDGTVKEIDHG